VALEEAVAEGRKHLCLTDPDARMMGEGRSRRVQECHSFEVAVDKGAGLLVVGQTTNTSSDNARLEAVLEAAAANEPEGVVAVDADSGYYEGDAIGRLLSRGLDLCVPDSNTAGDLHRGAPAGSTRDRQRGTVPLVYDEAADCLRCPQGNELRPVQRGHRHAGQRTTDYRAVTSCRDCPLASACLSQPNAQYRTVRRGEYSEALEQARQRFNDPEHRERYRHRGEAVETVFAFLRATLGYTRFLLRGGGRVACEGRLFRLAYQLRKVHPHWAAGQAG